MKRGGLRQGWLAALRRDRGLFAVVGALVLLLGLLQPLVAARAADAAGLSVLCSTVHSPAPDAPAQDSGCPFCPTGHRCALHGAVGAPALLLTWAIAFSAPAAPPLAPAAAFLASVDALAPPSIRAPPLSA